MARLETGIVQADDDWPGVFIRGDNAIAFAMSLQNVLNNPEDRIARMHIEGLAKLLASAHVHSGAERQLIHRDPVDEQQAPYEAE